MTLNLHSWKYLFLCFIIEEPCTSKWVWHYLSCFTAMCMFCRVGHNMVFACCLMLCTHCVNGFSPALIISHYIKQEHNLPNAHSQSCPSMQYPVPIQYCALPCSIMSCAVSSPSMQYPAPSYSYVLLCSIMPLHAVCIITIWSLDNSMTLDVVYNETQ